jgi:hypothetical protein
MVEEHLKVDSSDCITYKHSDWSVVKTAAVEQIDGGYSIPALHVTALRSRVDERVP